jgi:hypothetical protein
VQVAYVKSRVEQHWEPGDPCTIGRRSVRGKADKLAKRTRTEQGTMRSVSSMAVGDTKRAYNLANNPWKRPNVRPDVLELLNEGI